MTRHARMEVVFIDAVALPCFAKGYPFSPFSFLAVRGRVFPIIVPSLKDGGRKSCIFFPLFVPP